MRAVLQRVLRAAVTVDGDPVGRIGPGLLVLVGCVVGDGEGEAERLADRLAGLRCFPDERGRMNRSVLEARAEVLVVSQFTLAADLGRGRRPSFDRAAPPERAEPLIGHLADGLRSRGLVVATGRFGARMEVELVNDGPVTFVVDADPPGPP